MAVSLFDEITGITGIVAGIAGAYYAREQYRKPSRVTDSQQAFKDRREYLSTHRYELGIKASKLHQAHNGAGGAEFGPMLLDERYMFDRPRPLGDIKLGWTDAGGGNADEILEAARRQLPLRAVGQRFGTYSEAMGAVCRPAVFNNRLSYRIRALALDQPTPRVTLGSCHYFEMIDTAEALAHEFAAVAGAGGGAEPSWKGLRLRAKLQEDPALLDSRVVLPSVATLTLIRRTNAPWSFLMHWRDPALVAISANLSQVIPAGVFQPASAGALAVRRDLNLWRNIMREMAEEMLGMPEFDGSSGDAIDYQGTEPFAGLGTARRKGEIDVYCFGLGIDPLTLTFEFLTVAVVDEHRFADIFRDLVSHNEEGVVIRHDGGRPLVGIPFSRRSVREYLARGRLAPSAVACLQLAWQHRKALQGG